MPYFSTVADIFKQPIPFNLNGVTGYLKVYEPGEPPTSFQIMVDAGPQRYRYYGQLLFQQGRWRVDKDHMHRHLDVLVNLVMVWWG